MFRLILVVIAILAVVPGGSVQPVLGSDLASPARSTLDLAATDLMAGWAEGVGFEASGMALTLADSALLSEGRGDEKRYGVAESAPLELWGLFAVDSYVVRFSASRGAEVEAEIRGLAEGGWTEWREPWALDDLGGVSAIQTRVWLRAPFDDPSPRVFGSTVTLAPAVKIAQLPARRVPTVKLWATREGLVGGTTSNGHVIVENDRFAALPSKRALNRRDATDYVVMLRYRGRTAIAPVWDVGPWNMRDDYWNDAREQFADIPRWLPQAEAAFFQEHNGGRDAAGRFVTIPASIDLADGTFWEDLGMTSSDWVDVSFLWIDAASPSPRPAPVVTAKVPPSAPAQRARATSYSGIKPGHRLQFPLVQSEAGGWSSTLSIQNPSPVPVSGRVTVRDATGIEIGQTPFSLSPFGSLTVPVSAIPGVPSGFSGGASLVATGPVAAVLTGDRPGRDSWAYEGIGEVGPSSVLPLVFRQHNGWNTGLQLQNVGTQPTTVQVQYVNDSGSRVESVAISPLGTYTLYPAGGNVLDGSFAGSVVAQAENGQPIAVVATHVNEGCAAMAYTGSAGGVERLYAPLVFSRYHGWNSGLRLFNLAPSPVGAVVGYKGPTLGRSEAVESMTIPGSSALTLYQPADSKLPEGFVGSASIVAGPGSFLSGVVSKVRTGGQVAMTYAAGRSVGTVVALPSVRKAYDGWNTGIQVQNPGSSPVSLSMSLYDDDGVLRHRIDGSLEPGSAQTYYLPAMAEVPAGFQGSAIIQAPPSSPGLSVVVTETAG